MPFKYLNSKGLARESSSFADQLLGAVDELRSLIEPPDALSTCIESLHTQLQAAQQVSLAALEENASTARIRGLDQAVIEIGSSFPDTAVCSGLETLMVEARNQWLERLEDMQAFRTTIVKAPELSLAAAVDGLLDQLAPVDYLQTFTKTLLDPRRDLRRIIDNHEASIGRIDAFDRLWDVGRSMIESNHELRRIMDGFDAVLAPIQRALDAINTVGLQGTLEYCSDPDANDLVDATDDESSQASAPPPADACDADGASLIHVAIVLWAASTRISDEARAQLPHHSSDEAELLKVAQFGLDLSLRVISAPPGPTRSGSETLHHEQFELVTEYAEWLRRLRRRNR